MSDADETSAITADTGDTIASLYREPEPHRSRSPSGRPAVPRRLQDLPLGTGRDRRAARPRSRGRAAARSSPSSGRRAGARARCCILAAGLDDPSAGDVRAFGTSLAPARRTRAGRLPGEPDGRVIFQSDNLWPALTAEENVTAVLRLAGCADARRGGRRGRSTASASPNAATTAWPPSPAASSSAWRSPPLLLAAPRSCSPTSRPASSTSATSDRARRVARLRNDCGAAVVIVTHSPRVADAVDRMIELRDGRVVR